LPDRRRISGDWIRARGLPALDLTGVPFIRSQAMLTCMAAAGENAGGAGHYCRKCGRPIEADSVFCRHCGTPTPIQNAPAPSVAPHPTRRKLFGTKRRILIWGAAASVVLTIVIVLTIVYLPIPHSFSVSIPVAAGHSGNMTVTFPTGSHVSGTWSTNNGAAVAWFTIMTQLGGTIYQSSGVSGSFSFTATFSTYYFEAGAGPIAFTVEVTGTYSMPTE